MDRIKYIDFDLLIERTEQGYTARVINSPAGQAKTSFELPFSELELENFLLRVGQTRRAVRRVGSPEIEVAKTFGGRLFEAIFAGELQNCLGSSLDRVQQQEAGLRIRLRLTDAPDLADLPWEYLFNPKLNRFFSLSTKSPIVRYLDLPEHIYPLEIKPPLRILVMISNPSNEIKLDVEREWAKLQDAVSDLQQRGLVTLTRLEKATLEALQRQLRKEEYHIFHFVGHGGFNRQAQDGVLLLEDEWGQSREVSGQYLGTLLHDEDTLRLAILNACEGGRTSRTDPFAGVAQSLVQQGVPAVIAMQFEITDTAAITLAHEFYSALADNYPVDAALAEARKAILARGNDIEWGTPVLYMRAEDGRIFDVASISQEQQTYTQIATLDQAAQAAMHQGDWTTAIEKLKAVLELNPTHPQASAWLKQAQQQQELAMHRTQEQDNQPGIAWDEDLLEAGQTRTVENGDKDVATSVIGREHRPGRKGGNLLISFFDRIIRLMSNESNPWIRIGVPLGIGLLVLVGVILLVWRGLPAWIPSLATCKSALPTRLQAGDYAYVSLDPPNPNTLRSGAGSGYAEIEKIPIGKAVEILEGPRCVRDMLFWKVRVIESNKTGWTAEIGQENDQYTYWLVPCKSESECGNPMAPITPAQTYNEEGLVYFQNGDYPNALSSFTRAIELDPADVEAYHYRAHVYSRIGNYSYALADFYDVMKLDPTFRHPYYNLGKVYYEMGDYRNAIVALTSELELEGASDAYYWRGKSYQALDLIQEARADFEYVSAADARAKSALEELNALMPSVTPTATPTVGITLTPTTLVFRSGSDQYEPNNDFDAATKIAAALRFGSNFVPFGYVHEYVQDVDIFKLFIKPGLLVQCETSELSPFIDTIVTLYDENEQYIDQNDDIQPGYFASRVAYLATYDGLLYVQVVNKHRLEEYEVYDSDYILQCDMVVQPTVTPGN